MAFSFLLYQILLNFVRSLLTLRQMFRTHEMGYYIECTLNSVLERISGFPVLRLFQIITFNEYSNGLDQQSE